MTIKICTVCGVEKPITEYYLRSKKGTTPKPHCKECERIKSRKYHTDHPLPKEIKRERSLRKSFGIGLKDYNEMLVKQGGCCAICGTDSCSTGKSFAVDHDHQTGRIRGLLCRSCNTALGQFKDSIAMLQEAIKYLLPRTEN